MSLTAIATQNQGRGPWLALLMLGLALSLCLVPAAQAQIGPISVPGFGTLLWVPSSLVGPILALNPQGNVNVLSNTQLGDGNFALIQVQQGNLAVPASSVSGLLQLNVNVINNVQIGSNNVAIIGVSQGNAGG